MSIFAVTRGMASAGFASFGSMVATRALTLNYMDRDDPRGKTIMRVAGSVAPLFAKLLITTEEKSFQAGLLFGVVVIAAALQKRDVKVLTISLLVVALASSAFGSTAGATVGIAIILTPELPDLASILPFF